MTREAFAKRDSSIAGNSAKDLNPNNGCMSDQVFGFSQRWLPILMTCLGISLPLATYTILYNPSRILKTQ